MLRGIINRFSGRKKVEDESMDFSVVLEMLAGLNRATRINVSYSCGRDYEKFMGATPADVAKFVRKEFKPYSNTSYCEANHQVFSGEKDKKHYVDLRKGSIKTSVGTQEFRGWPHIQATLDYVLEAKD